MAGARGSQTSGPTSTTTCSSVSLGPEKKIRSGMALIEISYGADTVAPGGGRIEILGTGAEAERLHVTLLRVT